MKRPPVWRIVLVAVLVIGWVISIPYMWRAVTTVPSAARLQEMQSRIMHIPSPATFLRTTGRSFVELAVVVLLIWPWWRPLWLARLVVAFVALGVWAVMTVPLEQTNLELVHYRWLVGADALLLAAIIATVVARVVAAVQRIGNRPAG